MMDFLCEEDRNLRQDMTKIERIVSDVMNRNFKDTETEQKQGWLQYEI